MNPHVARRAGIPPFYVMDVWLAAAERQRTHGDLVNLSAGQPSAVLHVVFTCFYSGHAWLLL